MNIPKKIVVYISWFCLAVTALYIHFAPGIVPVPLNLSLAALPYQIDGWSGREKANPDYVTGAITDRLGSDDILMREYANSSGDKLDLYISYFNYTMKDKTPHPPQLCWVGGGWALNDRGEETLIIDGAKHPNIRIKKVLTEKDGYKVLLMYTYRINNRYMPDLFKFRAISVIDSILKRRNSAFTLQLSSSLGSDDPDKKEQQMRDFLSKVFARVESDFLP